MKRWLNTARVGTLTEFAKVVGPSSIVVAERAPKVDRREVAELRVNLVVADVVMEVGELVTVEVVVERSKSRQPDKNREGCGPVYSRGCGACSESGPL